MELFAHVTPKSAKNFPIPVSWEKGIGIFGKPLHHYKGSKLHRKNREFRCQGSYT
ncbi:Peptidyl-prolyl cis-trans isomerase [Spatholobus suberectus]|nr:Peptidyl-prolyl cis-trans isomerase [Spatholobus suberectus]